MSQVDDWSDDYTSDYLRDLNTYGPASANVPRPSVVSHQVRYQSPVVQTEARTNDTPMYTEDDARGAYVAPASGYRAPAGDGWDVNSSDTNMRFPNESGGKQYRTIRQTKKSAVRKSAVPSGDDVTSTVVQAVRADGNTSFANWRQSLKNEGWTEEQAKAIVYDPSSGKFINTAKSPSSGGALTPDEQAMAERAASHRAETPAAETPAAETPAAETPVKTDTQTSAPVSGAQPAPVSGAQSDAEIEQLRAQMRAEVNKLRGFGDFGNNAIALAQQWGDKILSASGKSDVEQMKEMIKQLQYWNSIAPGIVKMNGGN